MPAGRIVACRAAAYSAGMQKRGTRMKHSTLALLAAGALAASNASTAAPGKPMRIVVPNPAGGTVDVVARSVGHAISQPLGLNVVIDIRPGGNNIIGSEI